jgi:predicted RNA-binding Zn-ribbon protein involved in translation (DUF1610 family)
MVFIQSRATTDDNLVGEYAAMMREGVQFDAAQGVIDENGQIYVFDGLHRAQAAKRAGVLLQVEVRPGAKEEAEWLALSANQKHGLRRTQADKQRVVRSALLHPRGASLSDREIARHCGVDHKTVGRIRQEMELSGEIPQIDKRTVTRGEQVYKQDTGKIGQSQPATGEDDIKAVLKDALVNQHNQHQWAQRRAKGMSDQQLRDVISGQWNRGHSRFARGKVDYDCVGLKNPRIWVGEDARKIRAERGQPLQGQKLLDMVRAVLDIPYRPEVRYCHHCGHKLSLLAAEVDAEFPPPCPACHSSFRGMWVANPLAPTNGKQAAGPEPQIHQFECPRCGQERIVGVNGSRRWCLHCNAEWPTAADFLAEVEGTLKVHSGQIHTFTDEQLNTLLYGIIGLFIEFRDAHGQSEEQARFSAVNEALEGLGVFEVQA